MKILSIETSCDDTALAILEVKEIKTGQSFKILGSAIQSQTEIHAQYGGVFPMMAKREHQKNIGPVYQTVMTMAKNPKIDAIAVTVGPGLEPALWVGIVFAKELATKLKVPIIPVNHMEGHVLSVFPNKNKSFKVLSLLFAGGHTELVLMKGWQKYKKIGVTRDDAAGEAYDKIARMMDLPYPGGVEISRLANEERMQEPDGNFSWSGGVANGNKLTRGPEKLPSGSVVIKLPRPMIHSKEYDFSFSGLKTAVLYMLRDMKRAGIEITNDIKAKIAREADDAIVEVLVAKTLRAIKEHKIQTFTLGGGVSANTHLQEELRKAIHKVDKKIAFHAPTKGLSTDNAIMIGIAGYFQYKKKKFLKKNFASIKAQGNLSL